jgi:hypothetical protein
MHEQEARAYIGQSVLFELQPNSKDPASRVGIAIVEAVEAGEVCLRPLDDSFQNGPFRLPLDRVASMRSRSRDGKRVDRQMS